MATWRRPVLEKNKNYRVSSRTDRTTLSRKTNQTNNKKKLKKPMIENIGNSEERPHSRDKACTIAVTHRGLELSWPRDIEPLTFPNPVPFPLWKCSLFVLLSVRHWSNYLFQDKGTWESPRVPFGLRSTYRTPCSSHPSRMRKAVGARRHSLMTVRPDLQSLIGILLSSLLI